jgi:hypothetical protein
VKAMPNRTRPASAPRIQFTHSSNRNINQQHPQVRQADFVTNAIIRNQQLQSKHPSIPNQVDQKENRLHNQQTIPNYNNETKMLTTFANLGSLNPRTCNLNNSKTQSALQLPVSVNNNESSDDDDYQLLEKCLTLGRKSSSVKAMPTRSRNPRTVSHPLPRATDV